MARRPGSGLWSAQLTSDSRKALGVRSSYNGSSDSGGSWRHSGSINFTYRSGENLELRLGPSVTRSFTQAQYVSSRSDPLATSTFGRRYIFAPIDQTTLSLETRLKHVCVSYLLFLMVAARKHSLEEAARFSRCNKSLFSRFLKNHCQVAV